MASYPELSGRTVIVTGASGTGSIGAATARAFAMQGARTACVDIDGDGAEALAERLRRDGCDAIAIACDVTNSAQVSAMARDVLDRFHQIDVLVNNAGGFTEVESIQQISEETWDRMLALNLKSVFLCCQAAYAAMAERGSGRIINVASVQGRMPTRLNPAYYSAAKAGVLAFTKVLAQEMAQYNVTVNAVAPGATSTERFLNLRGEDGVEAIRRRIPLQRISTGDDQAAPILFLASDGASYMTGACLDVNGGSVML